jgi:alpha-glucosidase
MLLFALIITSLFAACGAPYQSFLNDEHSHEKHEKKVTALCRPSITDRSVLAYNMNDEAHHFDESYRLGWFTVTVNATGSFSIFRDDETLLATKSVPFLEALDFIDVVTQTFGIYHFRKWFETSTTMDTFLGAGWIGETLELTYSSRWLPWLRARLRFSLYSDTTLRCRIILENFLTNRGIRMRFDCNGENHFLGFGEQYNKTDQRGEIVPVWVSEQGLGRSENPRFPWEGNLHCTYFSMPWFLDPKGFGFLLGTSAYATFDLGSSCENEWNVEVWEKEQCAFYLFGGPEPLDVVSQLIEMTGRSRMPPEWAFSAWLSVQGGRNEVERVADLVLKEGIPVSAIWTQDWIGTRLSFPFLYELKYHWIPDEELYPDLEGMIRGLHDRGLRFLGYFNPFVVPRYEHFIEGALKGYLIKDHFDLPYIVLFADFFTSMVDLTNPDAVLWVQNYMADALEMGMDGWMADFGEWLPYDALLHDGTPASHYHNLYPRAWHELNLEILEAYRPDGDYVVFSRSGYTGESGVSQIVWAGDQEANWSDTDGLPTVIPAGLNLGISGVPFFTHDIAGFSGGPSTKELFFRWTELGAFTPIMRTHDGLMRGLNWNFERDEETLAHFRRYARIHEMLKGYIISCAEEYEETGHPIIRHHVLLYPDDPRSPGIDDQYFLGNDLLVAPVIERGKTTREVYLPEGSWYYIWDNSEYTGPADVTVDAPLEIIPVFSRYPVDREDNFFMEFDRANRIF